MRAGAASAGTSGDPAHRVLQARRRRQRKKLRVMKTSNYIVNTSVAHLALLLSAILLSSLFPSEPAFAQGCPTPSFGPASTFGVGVNSASVAVGDFNGDGKLDLAVANSGENPIDVPQPHGSVSVLLGNGDGTFQSAVTYSFTGTNLGCIVVGDFNGDGKPDLALANQGSRLGSYTDGGVSVLLGNGDGTFQPVVNYDAGSRLYSVTVGDFNGDGKPDLAVGGNHGLLSGAAGVLMLLGNGDGTFQTATNLSAAAFGASVVTGDFNGDGKLDLASPGVSVLLGNGDGTFQTAVDFSVGPNPNPVSVAVGDFNGDGKPDLAVANQLETAEYVSVLLNTCVSIGPALSIVSSNSTLTLFWPFPSAGFVLESATSLRPPDWQPAPESAVTNSGLLEVMVPVNAGSRYFRLHKP